MVYQPFFSNKADIKLAPLKVFAGIAHDLVESIFQQMISSNDQPEHGKPHS